MSAEVWLPLPGNDWYDVSNQGRVRSWYPQSKGSRAGRSTSPRIMRPTQGAKGYLVVSIFKPGLPVRKKYVHSLVLLVFVGPRPDGLEVRHLDGNPQNNTLANVCYGTHKENQQDIVRHGRHPHARKTHCPQNHPYDEANTEYNGKGSRGCIACRRAKQRKSVAA